MNYPAAELRGIKMNFYLINPDAEHRGILLIKVHEVNLRGIPWIKTKSLFTPKALEMSFALIIEIVWIMPSKITGNIGHA
jgi:hypothetical protein